jgi:hypothetical protein
MSRLERYPLEKRIKTAFRNSEWWSLRDKKNRMPNQFSRPIEIFSSMERRKIYPMETGEAYHEFGKPTAEMMSDTSSTPKYRQIELQGLTDPSGKAV